MQGPQLGLDAGEEIGPQMLTLKVCSSLLSPPGPLLGGMRSSSDMGSAAHLGCDLF